MKNLITISLYKGCQIPERYIRVRDLKELCYICQHWTSRRDLRKDKRYIVELEHGKCKLANLEITSKYTDFIDAVCELSNDVDSLTVSEFGDKATKLLGTEKYDVELVQKLSKQHTDYQCQVLTQYLKI